MELYQFLKQFVNTNRLNLIENKLQYRTRYITLVVENIYQSHNASAILRSAECFGIQDLYIIEKNNKFSISEEIALGAQNWVTLHTYSNVQDNTIQVVRELKAKGFRIIATTLENEATPLEDFDFTKGKAAIFVGTELKGLSQDVLFHADEYLKIPMRGFSQSLNVSVAAGIIAYFATFKIFNSNIAWQLTEEEKNELRTQWYKNCLPQADALIKYYYENFLNSSHNSEKIRNSFS